jgi:hypothetical protein
MDGALLPAPYLLSWTSQSPPSPLSTSEFRIKWSLNPEVHGITAPFLLLLPHLQRQKESHWK